MTHTTQDFEHVLDKANVVGVDYDEDGDIVRAYVSKKVPLEQLDADDVVDNATEKDTDVEEIGELEVQPLPEAQGERKHKHRPVPAGVSEINVNSTAATGGPFRAEVVDTSKGKWDDSVSEGDIVRVSNKHVYAPHTADNFGTPIVQPSPYDGGGPEDEVGVLVGFVPPVDGVSVDAAARTTDGHDTVEYHEMQKPSGVLRENYSGLKGETLIKTGRTTGVTTGTVKTATASVRVKYEGQLRLIRDTMITEHMSSGGDSGSPVLVEDTDELAGLVFAGSEKVSVLCKAVNVENELGVKFLTDNDNEEDNRRMTESLRTTVEIPMEERDLDMVEFSGDKPAAGETIEYEATVEGNYNGEAYLDVQDEHYEFTLTANTERVVPVEITAPDTYSETFQVEISGGYITSDES